MDWLLRVYGFSPDETALALDKNGNLSLGKDPKLAIAQQQPWLFPVDLNKADYAELLRVPGIGPTSAKRIIEARQTHSIDSLQQLKKMRITTNLALPFIWFKGIFSYGQQTSFMAQLDDAVDQPARDLAACL
jgi:predicted DNA-binding helix-hairpin-helix protein